MGLITLTVKEQDTIVYQTAKSKELDPARIKRVKASGASDSLVHYYDPQQSRVVEYVVDEDPAAVLALAPNLRFINEFRHEGNPFDGNVSANVVLINEEDAVVGSSITKDGPKRIEMNMGDKNHLLNKEVEEGSKIILAVSGTKKFTVKGDQTAIYKNADKITVAGSPDNDGTFTLAADSALVGSDTEITVVEVITDVAGGFISTQS